MKPILNELVGIGLLIVAHGAGPEWNGPVRETAAQVRWNGPVQVAFLMGPERQSAGWDSAVARLVRAGASSIVVVPLLVSSHGEHYDQIRWLAGELDSLPAALAAHQHHERHAPPVPMRVTAALDAAPELADALLLRFRALDERDRSRPLLLVAHGPSSDTAAARWHDRLGAAARSLRAAGAAEVRIALLRDDAAPPVRAAAVAEMRDTVVALAERGRDSVLALPVLISTSALATVRIPRDLANLPARYVALPLAPLPPLARWVERVAVAMMSRH